MMGEPASIEVERASYTPARASRAVRSSRPSGSPPCQQRHTGVSH